MRWGGIFLEVCDHVHSVISFEANVVCAACESTSEGFEVPIGELCVYLVANLDAGGALHSYVCLPTEASGLCW